MIAELVGIAVFTIGCGIVHSRILRNMALRKECATKGHQWMEAGGYLHPICVRCGHTPEIGG